MFFLLFFFIIIVKLFPHILTSVISDYAEQVELPILNKVHQ